MLAESITAYLTFRKIIFCEKYILIFQKAKSTRHQNSKLWKSKGHHYWGPLREGVTKYPGWNFWRTQSDLRRPYKGWSTALKQISCNIEEQRNSVAQLGASPLLAKALRKFNPNYKRLNVFWIWPASKVGSEGARQFNSFKWLPNFSNLVFQMAPKTCKMWSKWRWKSFFFSKNQKNRLARGFHSRPLLVIRLWHQFVPHAA